MDALLRDVRHAVRGLARRPTYTIVTILTLALVIGAATALVAVVNATMLRPLPYPDADRLARIFQQPPGTTDIRQRNPLNTRAFVRFRDGALQTVDAVEGFWARDRALGGDTEPESVPGALASPGALELLGGPLLGRTWTADEDRAGARLAVIAHGLWQRRFGADPVILGKTLLIDREPHLIVGVMPPGFRAIYIDAEVWTPLNAAALNIDNPSTFIQSIVRLKPGVTLDQLRVDLSAAMARVVDEAPNALKGWTANADGVREAQFALQRPALLVLLLAVGALALIACANLANLTLAQVMSRRAETALRAALGAGRRRVIQLQLVESLLLSTLGAAGGLLLGTVTLPVLLALDPQTARTLGEVTIDWRVQALIAFAAIGVALLSGVVPLVADLSGDVARGLADGNRRSAGSRRDERVRRLLVALEAALTVVLLVAGGLLLSGFDRAARTNPGFDPAHVLGAQLRLPNSVYPTDAARNAFATSMLERVRSVPGVVSAATTLNAFTPGFAMQTLIHIDGRPTPDGQPHAVWFRRISTGYFETLRIPRLAGRDFEVSDGPGAPTVAIISRSFAERFWPGEDALGRRVRRSATLLTVVGIVEDVADAGIGQPGLPALYVPYAQGNPGQFPVALVVRTAGDPLASAAAVRAAVLSVDPAQPIDRVTTLERFMADSLGPQRFRATLLLVLAGLGLALASVGIYAVTARSVEERRREMAVRLALGAAPAAVWRLVVGHALVAVLAGMVAGGVAAAGATALLSSWLPGLDSADPWSAIVAVTTLAISASIAAAWPAWRAAGVSPALPLRGE